MFSMAYFLGHSVQIIIIIIIIMLIRFSADLCCC